MCTTMIYLLSSHLPIYSGRLIILCLVCRQSSDSFGPGRGFGRGMGGRMMGGRGFGGCCTLNCRLKIESLLNTNTFSFYYDPSLTVICLPFAHVIFKKPKAKHSTKS